MSYSIKTNKPEDRVEFLEETIKAIFNVCKDFNLDISDKEKMPIEQLLRREIYKLKKEIYK